MHMKLAYIAQNSKAKNEHVVKHTHQCYEIVYYRSGSGTTKIGGTLYAFSSGDIAVIPPNTPHDETHNSKAEIIFFGYHSNTPVSLCGIYNADIEPALYEILSETSAGRVYGDELISLCIQKIVLLLRRSTYPDVRAHNDLDYAKNFIKENFFHKISISALAASCGYSVDYFRHLFRQTFGRSPQALLLDTRIMHASHMLAKTDKKATEIALLCGFSTSAQFSSLFKKHTGKTPSLYRAEQRKFVP